MLRRRKEKVNKRSEWGMTMTRLWTVDRGLWTSLLNYKDINFTLKFFPFRIRVYFRGCEEKEEHIQFQAYSLQHRDAVGACLADREPSLCVCEPEGPEGTQPCRAVAGSAGRGDL